MDFIRMENGSRMLKDDVRLIIVLSYISTCWVSISSYLTSLLIDFSTIISNILVIVGIVIIYSFIMGVSNKRIIFNIRGNLRRYKRLFTITHIKPYPYLMKLITGTIIIVGAFLMFEHNWTWGGFDAMLMDHGLYCFILIFIGY